MAHLLEHLLPLVTELNESRLKLLELCCRCLEWPFHFFIHGLCLFNASVSDIERFLKLLLATPGTLRLDRIIEKGFCIDSRKSLLLQLADLCTLYARKDEERKIGLPPKIIDESGIALLQHLLHRGEEAFPDVIQWLQQVQK